MDVREDVETVRSFVMDKRLAYPVLIDSGAEVAARYQVRGIPTLLVIDRTGKVVYRGYQLPPTAVIKPLL